jgi:hypothetical protein
VDPALSVVLMVRPVKALLEVQLARKVEASAMLGAGTVTFAALLLFCTGGFGAGFSPVNFNSVTTQVPAILPIPSSINIRKPQG